MLLKYLVVFITTSVISSSARNTSEWSQNHGELRIYSRGGRPVKLGEFPFLVFLTCSLRMQQNCIVSGSIPSPTTVLTSAFCPFWLLACKAYAGLVDMNEISNTGVQERDIKNVAVAGNTEIYDVVICFVNKRWEWTPSVAPVTLHLTPEPLQPSSVISCQVMGFGMTGDDWKGAHVMSQNIGDYTLCFDQNIGRFDFLMCSRDVKDKTVCFGDYGGPVMYRGKQWAMILREAPQDVRSTECRPPKIVNSYSNISYYREFIYKNIKDLSSADSIQRYSVKISLKEVLVHPPLWLLLILTAELLHLH